MRFRFLQGFLHAFTYVYFPTWTDQFGLQNYKTIMTSFIQTTLSFGSIFGFNATTFLGDYKYGFASLAFTVLPLDFILLFMNDKFFSPKIFFYKVEKEEHVERKSVFSLFEIDENVEKVCPNSCISSSTILTLSLKALAILSKFSRFILKYILVNLFISTSY